MRAIDIARWFVAWAENTDAEVSNLKLQKLLYYAQGHHLVQRGNALYPEEIQAWAHGPVVPPVYRAFKDFGRNPIDPDAVLSDDFDWDQYREVEELLIDIWDRYGALAAWALREKTHREAPWKDAFDQASRDTVIPKPAIAAYFASHDGG